MKDSIRVFFCERCGRYELDFNVNRLFCERCGKELTFRIYKWEESP